MVFCANRAQRVQAACSSHASETREDSETPEDVVCAPELRCIILAFGRHYSEAGETSPANAACKARSREGRKYTRITHHG